MKIKIKKVIAIQKKRITFACSKIWGIENSLSIKFNWFQKLLIKIAFKGIKINSDVNGSLQIIKKVFPNAFSHGIEGYGFNPIRVGL